MINLPKNRKKHRSIPKAKKLQNLNESLKAVTREYCRESSICGLKHLVDDNIPYMERLVWKITLVGALMCSVSLVWMTFDKYYKAPLVTTQLPEGMPVSKIIFPAIGICTNNRISKRTATELAKNLIQEKRNSKYNETEMLSLLLGLGQLYNLQPANENTVPPLELHHALGDYDVNELLKNLTPTCEDLLLKCCWNELPTNCLELFDFRLTMDGYCCTFNYLRKSDVNFEIENDTTRNIDMYKYGNKSDFDYDQGLKVLLRVNETDDFYYNVPLRGVKLQFSDAYDFPDDPSGSFSLQIVSPAIQMTINVIAAFTEASRDIQHVALNLRRCLFYDESPYLPFYTYSDCLLKCRMLFLLEKCNCTPFNMLKLKDARTCDLTDVVCLRKYYVQSINVRPEVDLVAPELELEAAGGGISCPMCYPTCSKTIYNYGIYNVDIYPDRLNTVADSDRDKWLQGAPDFTGTSIVHVKYAREVADCYGQNVIMKWFDLFSNIGSTCGFVTGFSFVSVLEFIYFFTIKLFRDLERRRNGKLPSFPSENLARDRPIYWNELPGPKRLNELPID